MSAWISLRRFSLYGCVFVSSNNCSLVIDVDGKQCNTDVDCAQHGLTGQCQANVCVPPVADTNGSCASDADCSGATPRCLFTTHACVSSSIGEQFICLPPSAAETETVHYQFNVRLSGSDLTKVPDNLVVQACALADVVCNDPLAVFTDAAGDGVVKFDLPWGQPVYFKVTSIGRTVFSYTSDISTQENPKVRDIFVPTRAFSDTFSDAGLTSGADPDKGSTLIQLEDCSGRPAGGVHFKVSPESGDDFYLHNSLPDSDASLTSYDERLDLATAGLPI